MNTTLQPAVHLGKDHEVNLRFVKNNHWRTTGQLFRETEKSVSGQTETTGISLISFQCLRWVSTSLLHSRAYQYSIATVYVFSDSVLCLGKMGDNLIESWKKQIQWFSHNEYFSELKRIDGQPMEFEWEDFKIMKRIYSTRKTVHGTRWDKFFWLNLEKLVQSQSQMHSDCDSAECIADSDLEDGELRIMLASPLYMQSREDCESSRMPIAPVKPAAL